MRFGSNDGPIATLLSWGMRNGALQAAAFLLAEDRNVKGVSTGATETKDDEDNDGETPNQ